MKRKLSLVLAVILAFSLIFTGCNSPEGTGNQTTATNAETSASSQADQSTATSPAEKITWDSPDISWKKDTTPVTLSCFLDYSWWPLDSWGLDDVSKEITKMTGVSLEITKAIDEQQLQVMLAGNELPDLVYTANLNYDGNFQKPEVSYAYDELINKYCPEFMSLLDPVQIFINTADDGHFYAIRSHYSNKEDWNDPRNGPGPGSTAFHFRQDIYEALGKPAMNSMDDILNVFKMVKEKYPDMIPYLGYGSSPFVSYMGYQLVSDGGQLAPVKLDDKVVLSISQPGFVDIYKFMNKLYANGYSPKESLSYKYEQFLQIVRSGKVFSASYNAIFSDEQNKFFDENNIEGMWTPLVTPPTVNGEVKMNVSQFAVGWSNLYITKQSKNPDRAIKYMEFLKSPEGDQLAQWGLENSHYTLTSDGLLQRTEAFTKLTMQQAGVGPSFGLWCFGASGLREGIISKSIALSNPKYALSGELLKNIKPYYNRDPILFFANPKSGTDMGIILTKLTQLLQQTEPKMLLASSEAQIEEIFNVMLEQANKAGLADVENYMTEEYAKAKVKYDETLKKYTAK